jgi:hypothetical protein
MTMTMAAQDYVDMITGAERPDGVHERQAEDRGRHGPRDEDAEPFKRP